MNKRKPGGQKQNKNALKHGFYSELLTAREIARLNKVTSIDLDDEIKLLRSMIYKLKEKTDLNETISDDVIKRLNTMANMIQVINTTQRTKLLARGAGGEIQNTIMEAIMSLDPYKEL